MQSDIGEPYREAMKVIDAELNRLLEGVSFGSEIEQWAFLAIIRKEDSADYREVARKSSRGKVAEFRLKISHVDFASASRNGQILLILASLSRSVTLMEQLGVPTDTLAALRGVLSCADERLVRKKLPSEIRRQ